MGDDLTSRLIGLGDGGRLLESSQDFRACHQDGRLTGLDSATGRYSQRDCRHAFVVGNISNDDEIIITEAIPTAKQFAADGLARLTAYSFNTIGRLLDLRSPRLSSVCR